MDRKEFAKQALWASAMVAAAPVAGRSRERSSLLEEAGLSFRPLFNGRDLSGFVDVNTSEDTWWVEDGILKATGEPIGVIRTEKQYQNFILDIEWRHMEPGGNSGVFVWSDGTPYKDNPYPKGMEVQMLDTQWAEINDRPVEYVHGHLFPAMNLEGTIPDNPSEIEGRSYALENRVKGTGQWNRYIVVCVDGTIKLSVNGKFVNGIRSTERKKGYICPESEGAEVHFRKIDIMELPDGVITPDQAAPVVD
ncbi:3-keto-disaccharide hydrolase [Fodinibius sediminis]|uniref:3-keto-alpha-glucoside-1,2-lyase/3-keto-2-hydroxy-glucal hydratase domain-containing protein n=1 Tax=Fodinibius sediminis TaxID=1214077 RepID=A0A521CF72_9BACT|nr:DUF1080 domain-containing protein [Fodinibius sediminis]SMO58069.1 protein of unknown function [Fodinibius sediminis]